MSVKQVRTVAGPLLKRSGDGDVHGTLFGSFSWSVLPVSSRVSFNFKYIYYKLKD